jgi:hypothetical protein
MAYAFVLDVSTKPHFRSATTTSAERMFQTYASADDELVEISITLFAQILRAANLLFQPAFQVLYSAASKASARRADHYPD